METLRQVIEWVALSIEVLAVLVIVAAIVLALARVGASGGAVSRSDIFTEYKRGMGRGLLLSLELLLAADIIDTVALRQPTLQSLGSLGLLALIRSFLSWSLEVEIDGCWPWRVRAEARPVESGGGRVPKTSTNE